jgi:hypothetical protein
VSLDRNLRRRPTKWLLALLLCVHGLSACGGPTSLADYFDEMQATSDEAEARYLTLTDEATPMLAALSFSPADGWDPDIAAAGEQLLTALSDEAVFTPQAVEADRVIFAGLHDMLTYILSRIEAIDVPTEATASHAEMVGAAAGWAEVVTDITGALTRVQSAQELVGSLTPLDLERRFDAIHERFTRACLDLQAVADLDGAASFDFNGPWLASQSAKGATAAFSCGEG